MLLMPLIRRSKVISQLRGRNARLSFLNSGISLGIFVGSKFEYLLSLETPRSKLEKIKSLKEKKIQNRNEGVFLGVAISYQWYLYFFLKQHKNKN